MSRALKLQKSRWPEWVAALQRTAAVIAPVRLHGEDVAFERITSPSEITLDFDNTADPPKRFLFPQVEPLLRYRRNGGYAVEPVYDEEPRVFFAIRCCDVSAVRFFDFTLGAQDLPDSYYTARRAGTALIALACHEPCQSCFCVCADTGPFLPPGGGYDIQLTDLGGEHYLAEVDTDKGEALVAAAAELFAPASDDDLAQRRALEEASEKRFPSEPRLYFAASSRKVSLDTAEAELWQRMARWCVACGGCTHICPTCYCFNVTDAQRNGDGLRSRRWDSCQYAGLTREASGHNPRPEQSDRVKRRVFHKISYQYVARDGMQGCVGCGRCTRICPGLRLGLPEVGEAIRRAEWK
ncbi:MAG: 4Fe-4S dicluster domain-containing protein [Armatimonadota bacterium]|nr:MAG: 4Fe-4S dicluster domain-containing protein [Armatimonadota bacterium]